MKIKNILSVLVLMTITLFNKNLTAACNSKDGSEVILSAEWSPPEDSLMILMGEPLELLASNIDDNILGLKYEWTIDGADAGDHGKIMAFSPAEPGEMSIVCKVSGSSSNYDSESCEIEKKWTIKVIEITGVSAGVKFDNDSLIPVGIATCNIQVIADIDMGSESTSISNYCWKRRQNETDDWESGPSELNTEWAFSKGGEWEIGFGAEEPVHLTKIFIVDRLTTVLVDEYQLLGDCNFNAKYTIKGGNSVLPGQYSNYFSFTVSDSNFAYNDKLFPISDGVVTIAKDSFAFGDFKQGDAKMTGKLTLNNGNQELTKEINYKTGVITSIGEFTKKEFFPTEKGKLKVTVFPDIEELSNKATKLVLSSTEIVDELGRPESGFGNLTVLAVDSSYFLQLTAGQMSTKKMNAAKIMIKQSSKLAEAYPSLSNFNETFTVIEQTELPDLNGFLKNPLAIDYEGENFSFNLSSIRPVDGNWSIKATDYITGTVSYNEETDLVTTSLKASTNVDEKGKSGASVELVYTKKNGEETIVGTTTIDIGKTTKYEFGNIDFNSKTTLEAIDGGVNETSEKFIDFTSINSMEFGTSTTFCEDLFTIEYKLTLGSKISSQLSSAGIEDASNITLDLNNKLNLTYTSGDWTAELWIATNSSWSTDPYRDAALSTSTAAGAGIYYGIGCFRAGVTLSHEYTQDGLEDLEFGHLEPGINSSGLFMFFIDYRF